MTDFLRPAAADRVNRTHTPAVVATLATTADVPARMGRQRRTVRRCRLTRA
ncbi:hypothetical protein ACWZEH_04340 [Streptomyces sp. QTS137]